MKQIFGIGRRTGQLYELVYLPIPKSFTPTLLSTLPSTNFLDIWHSRLGHISYDRLKLLISSGILGNVKTKTLHCLPCQLGKQHALPFYPNEMKSVAPFDLIHSDVWGPAPIPTMGGARYFVTFIDDHTRFTWIYLMKQRSELPQIYITFARMIQTQFNKPIKVLRTDNAIEYKESSLLNFLHQQGTVSQYS